MKRFRGGLLAFVVVAVALATGRTAPAEDGGFEELAKLVRSLLKSADADDIAKVVESLGPEIKDGLAASAVDTYHVCDAVADYARPMTRHSAENAEKIVEWTLDLAERALKASPDDVSARWAKACALLARGRAAAEAGKKPPPEDWAAAAELFVENAKESGGTGRAQVLAIECLVEAAALPDVDPVRLLDRADELAAQAGSGARGSVAVAQARFARARWLGTKALAKAKPLLDEALAALGPLCAAEKPDMDAATLHAAIVTYAKAAKVPGKIEYQSVEKTAGPLRLRMPLSRHWEGARRGADLGSWNQYDDLGNLVRSIDVWEYDWTVNYIDEGTSVGGDNVKGLVKRDQQRVRQNFSKVSAEKPLTKAVLNRFFPLAYSYELAGTYENGDFARVRTYYFKSKERLKTYNVEFYEYVDTPKLDPEIRFVLDSIEETKKEKK